MQQAEWMEKYEDLLGTEPVWDPDVQLLPTERRRDADNDDDCDDDGGGGGDVSLDSLRHLLELGVGLPPHPALEKALAKLQGLLDASEKIDDKAADALQSKSVFVLRLRYALRALCLKLDSIVPRFAGLYRVLLGFTGFYSKLDHRYHQFALVLWLSSFFCSRSAILTGFTGFYWVCAGYYWVFWDSPGFTGFHWVLL